MAEAAEEREPAERWIAWTRLGIGLAQGLAFWLLTEARGHKVWPATDPAENAALLIVVVFAPLILLGGLGRIRAIPLAVWTAVAALVLAIFAWHDMDAGIWNGLHDPARLDPAMQVFVFGAVFVFVGHHLVGPADESRKLVAPYPLYFDWAWKDAVQVVLSVAFVAVLWAALELGAALFGLIGIDAVGKVLHKGWVAAPLTGVGFAAGVQLTDVRAALIRGVRTVGLVLFSWLLPVMAMIVVAFLAALPFTGLAPLFGTRSGAGTVLSASAALIILTSATYQDGATAIPRVLRWAGRAAGLALVPLVLIGADALWQRVAQHGLTPARIEAIACAIVAAGFAAGYVIGAVRRTGPWLKPLELTNVIMARVVMLLILVLFTPIADPARLAVDDQVGRLLSGKVGPDKFDFDFLTYNAGRYGSDALKALAARKGSPRDAEIAQRAVTGKAAQTPMAVMPAGSLAAHFHVFPANAQFPASFASQDWTAAQAAGEPYQACFANITQLTMCDAYVLDVDGDHAPEVLMTQDTGGDVVQLDVYKQAPAGKWGEIGTLTVVCPDAIAALKAGKFQLTPRTGLDVVTAGRRQVFVPTTPMTCPQPPDAKTP